MAKVTVLTYGGEEWAAGRMAGEASTNGAYLGWGTGSGTATKADTALFTPASEARVLGTVSLEGSGVSAAYQVEGILSADAPKTITNAGNFTALTGGTLVVHGSFDGIDLEADDQITFTITIDPS